MLKISSNKYTFALSSLFLFSKILICDRVKSVKKPQELQHIRRTERFSFLRKMVSEGKVSALTLCDITKCQLS